MWLFKGSSTGASTATQKKEKFVAVFEQFFVGKDPSKPNSITDQSPLSPRSEADFWDETLLIPSNTSWLYESIRSAMTNSPDSLTRLRVWVPRLLHITPHYFSKEQNETQEEPENPYVDLPRSLNAIKITAAVLRGVFEANVATPSPFDLLSHVMGGPSEAESTLQGVIAASRSALLVSSYERKRELVRLLLVIACASTNGRANPLTDCLVSSGIATAITTPTKQQPQTQPQVMIPELVPLCCVLIVTSPPCLSTMPFGNIQQCLLPSIESELTTAITTDLLDLCASTSSSASSSWFSFVCMSASSSGGSSGGSSNNVSTAAPQTAARLAAPLLVMREMCRFSSQFCTILFKSHELPAVLEPTDSPSTSLPTTTTKSALQVDIADKLLQPPQMTLDSQLLLRLIEATSYSLALVDRSCDPAIVGMAGVCLDTLQCLLLALHDDNNAAAVAAHMSISFEVDLFSWAHGSLTLSASKHTGSFAEFVIDLCGQFLRRNLFVDFTELYDRVITLIHLLVSHHCSIALETTTPSSATTQHIRANWSCLWTGLFHYIRFLSKQLDTTTTATNNSNTTSSSLLTRVSSPPLSLSNKGFFIQSSVKALDLLCMLLVHGDHFADSASVDSLWYELARGYSIITKLSLHCGTSASAQWKTATLMNEISSHISCSIQRVMAKSDYPTPEMAMEAAIQARSEVQLDEHLMPISSSITSTCHISQGSGRFFFEVLKAACHFGHTLLI